MKLLPLFFLLVIVTAKSSTSSRGSSKSRSSLSSSRSSSRPSSSSKTSSSRSSSSSSHSSLSSSSHSKSSGSKSRFLSSKSSTNNDKRQQVGSKQSRGSSAARAQVAKELSSSKNIQVNGQQYPSRFQRIRTKISETAKEKIPGFTRKVAEKLRPKLPMIARAAKKVVPKIGKYVYNKLRGTTTSQPFISSTVRYITQQVPVLEDMRFTPNVPVNGDEIFIPYNDDFLASCPESVDAFLQLENISFIFEGHHMFLIEDGSLNQTSAISDLFPGIHKVDASVFDSKKEIVLLFKERKVYGYQWVDEKNEFKAADGYPKDLPNSISFAPSAAFIWRDGYVVLVSDDGHFSVYDSYFNKEINSGDNYSHYLENLPKHIRGISDWDGQKAVVFTNNKVFQYDFEKKDILGDGESLEDFLDCFFVEIPSTSSETKL